MIRIKSPAKINLFLHINGRLDSGFHTLQTLMCKLELSDFLVVSENKLNKTNLKISGNFGHDIAQDSHNNLIIKTINLMHEEFNTPKGFDISLEKKIPIAAGLGGGSSNAGVLIKHINKKYNLNLSLEQIYNLSQKIGSDIMFFTFESNFSMCENTGNKISPIRTTKFKIPILIINPLRKVFTPKVYADFVNAGAQFYKENLDYIVQKDHDMASILDIIRKTENQLTQFSIKQSSEIADILGFFEKQKETLISRMSGSGSTCFALCENEDDLDRLYYKTKLKFHGSFINKSFIIS